MYSDERSFIVSNINDVRGFKVVGEAESGEQAFQFCRTHHPDVVLMDMNMPGIGGLEATKKIVFFGDSLTAGYGLDDVNNAFPGLIQKNIDSLNLPYTVINSGVSGETTAGGKGRIDWVLNQKPDIFILELGANDGLRGVPLSETKENLQRMFSSKLLQRSPINYLYRL